jgi:methylglutaconyl-CoA hydratase
MLAELTRQFASLAADPDVRIIVLSANGRHFCVGADLSERRAGQAPRVDLFDTLKLIDECPKLTVAVVQGACIGGGLALAACCDVVLATDQAYFSIPEVRLGIVPMLAPLFVRAIGQRAVRHYGLTGQRFSAAEAAQFGLVHTVGEAAAIDAALRGLIDEAMNCAPKTLAALKEALAHLAAPGPERLFPVRSMRPDFDNMGTPEAVEGLSAFREKRKPSWYR